MGREMTRERRTRNKGREKVCNTSEREIEHIRKCRERERGKCKGKGRGRENTKTRTGRAKGKGNARGKGKHRGTNR